MVNGNLRGGKFVVITLIITIFLFGNVVIAEKMKISAQEAEKIKTVLGITQTLVNISKLIINDNDLATILNKAIDVGRTGTDLTYGLLVLSALNEMELMDLVLSQRYKTEARDYFNQVLKEKTDLLSYWKGVGIDIPKVASGYITGPIAGLTLNSFAITDKAIAIFGEFNIVKKMKLYDGLWYYFDLRKNGNESHDVAWGEAKIVMNWALEGTSRFRGAGSNRVSELEQQFAALYEKWGPYATPWGIDKKYKEQLASELRNTLATAIKENTEVRPLYVKEPSLWDKFLVQLANIKNTVADLVSQINPFKAGPIVDLPDEKMSGVGLPTRLPTIEEPELIEVRPQSIQPQAPEIKEEMEEVLSEEEMLTPEPELTPEPVPVPAPAPVPEPTLEIAPAPITASPALCQKTGANPARFRVLINEVAWMGTEISANNEWIELKNIWGIPLSLSNWQLLDKDQQIKIIFGENDVISAGEYFLLERTKDYTGALNNSNEALYLFDNNCQLEDEVLANPDWPAGDNFDKKTMQRFDVLYWYAGPATAGRENSPPSTILSHHSAPAPTQQPTPSKPTYSKILITETRTSSPGNQKDDFVEIYNPNSGAVNLTDWYLQRKTETGQDFSSYAPASLFSGKTIEAKDYFLIANASSSLPAELIDISTTYPLTENNTLVLKNPNQEIVDEALTDNPSPSKSFGRKRHDVTQSYLDTDNIDDFEIQNPTPKTQNQSSEEDEDEESEEGSVVINEIAWAGTKANFSDEWIELYNNTNENIDLTGWRLVADDISPNIVFTTSTISAHGYFLLERTNDDAIGDIAADWFGSFGQGGLSNNPNCEILFFYDRYNNLIDKTVCSEDGDWPAGQNDGKITMERINPLAESDLANWASNNRITRNGLDAGNPANLINGTPKAQNSVSKSSTEIQGVFTIDGNLTLTYLGSPYLVEGSINVSAGAKLIIEPEVIIKFKHNNYWKSQLNVGGELEAVGVIFTSSSTESAAGDWDGLYFQGGSTGVLDNVTISYAGKLYQSCCYEYPPYTYGAVYIDGGQVQIKNSLIEKSKTLGVWLKNSTSTLIDGVEFSHIEGDWEKSAAVYIESSSSTIKNSTFHNNNVGIWIESLASSTIENNVFENNQTPVKTNTLLTSFSGNTAQNNNLDGILVLGLGFSDTVNQIDWQKDNLPYILESSAIIALGKTLNIQPGVTVKLKSGGRIYVDGTLKVQGSESEKIIFTSLTQETAGSWNFISFSASSVNSILAHAIIRYGGWYNVFQGGTGAKSGAVKVNSTALIIENSLFESNLYAGLELINSTTTLENVAFNKNEHGIYVEAGECPDLTGVSFGTGDNANSVNIYPSNCS